MKIFVTHSTSFDFKNEFYKPIKDNFVKQDISFYFPEDRKTVDDTKKHIKDADIVFAEISFPSTGSGIELGWANLFGVPIYCVYKSGCKPSSALKIVSDKIFEYANEKELVEIIEKIKDKLI